MTSVMTSECRGLHSTESLMNFETRSIWAAMSDNIRLDMCTQQRFTSGIFAVCSESWPGVFWIPRMQSFFIWTTKTDQTARMHMLIWVYVGCTSESTFLHVAAHLPIAVKLPTFHIILHDMGSLHDSYLLPSRLLDRLGPVSSDYIFFLIILFNNPLK